MCDFTGFKIPEMIKKRRVVIIRKHRENSQLVAVVPISLTVPNTIQKYHYKLDSLFCENHFQKIDCWVKSEYLGIT